MSENIVIDAGKRFRRDGALYQVTEQTEVPAVEVENFEPQKNAWLALVCPDPACREMQGKLNRGSKPVIVRGSKAMDRSKLAQASADKTVRPICGVCCSERMIWQVADVAPADVALVENPANEPPYQWPDRPADKAEF
jgi:hypothetical protein